MDRFLAKPDIRPNPNLYVYNIQGKNFYFIAFTGDFSWDGGGTFPQIIYKISFDLWLVTL